MKFLIIFSLLNFTLASEDVSFNLRWKLIRDNGISTVWKARDAKSTYASITSEKRKSDINLYKNESFLKEILAKKKKMLTFSGISNWESEKQEWVKSKNGDIYLIFKGSYKDHQDTPIRFLEVHKFSKDKITQILYSQPKSKKFNSDLKDQLLIKYGVNL